MKPNSLTKVALLTTGLALGGIGLALAQDNPTPPAGAGGTVTQDATTPTTPPPGGGGGGGKGGGWGHHRHPDGLTPEENAELAKDREQVFSTHPDLKKEADDLRSQRPGPDSSDADKAAFRQKMEALDAKLRPLVEAIDPNAAALYAKMDAFRQAHPPGPPPSGQ